jgi:hypothetical protein
MTVATVASAGTTATGAGTVARAGSQVPKSRTVGTRARAGTRTKTSSTGRQTTGRTSQPAAYRPRYSKDRLTQRAREAPVRIPEEALARPATVPTGYTRWVLVEFIVTLLVVASHPFLAPRKGQEVSPATKSLAMPLVRLTAVCLIYFVLALMASGPRAGKVAAAFGGLVMVGTIMNATDSMATITTMMRTADKKAKKAKVEDDEGGIPA